MGYTVPHRWTLVALAVLLVGLVGWPAPTGAQISPGTPPGTIIIAVAGPDGTVTGTLGSGITTVLGGTADLGGIPGALDASALTGGIAGLLSAEFFQAAAIGSTGRVVSEASIADLALEIAGTTVDVDFVMARATSVLGAAGTGSAAIVNLIIGGVPIAATGAPNQTIAILGGQVVINEVVQSSPTGIVVNALHIRVPGVADVIIGSASADASTVTGQASAVRATGLK